MKRISLTLSVMLLFALLVVACSPAAQPTQPPVQVQPTQVLPPAEAPTSQILPTAEAPATEAPTLLPTIAPPPAQPLAVTENDRFCLKKVPYTLIGMPETATYQMLTDGFVCSEGGIQKGQHLITCTGPMYSLFQIQVCDGGNCQEFEFGTTNCP